MAGLFENIVETIKEAKKEGKLQYGLRYNPDLKVGGGYYDDNKMFEVDVDGEYVVDTGHIVAFTDGLDYDISRIGGYKSLFFSGEGFSGLFTVNPHLGLPGAVTLSKGWH